MLGKRLRRYGSQIYLVNTGWSGGQFGIGSRMDIDVTRRLVHAALSGEMADVEYDEDPLFHVLVPRVCTSVDSKILNPRNTWSDGEAFDRRALKLATDFCAYFDKSYTGKGIEPAVAAQCPGK